MIDKLFLSVGAMKAGTTWLHRQFAMHPDVFFSPEKEIHFFADPRGDSGPMLLERRIHRYQQVVKNLNPKRFGPRTQQNLAWYAEKYLALSVNLEWYESLFAARSAEAYCADFSNLYALLDDGGWRYVQATAEVLRVVYTLRDPVDRLWSHVKFHHEFTGELHQLSHWKREDYAAFVARPYVADHTDYAGVIRRLRRHLTENELLIQFFEDVREHPSEALARIESFLGIASIERPPKRLTETVNPSQQLPQPPFFREVVGNLCRDQIGQLVDLGLKLPEAWMQQRA